MIRDFTLETYNRLKEQIEQVATHGLFDKIGDVFNDLYLYMNKWIGLLSLDDDMSNIKLYQKNVIDMTNMSKRDLKKIFERVSQDDEDFNHKYFGIMYSWQATYNDKLRILNSFINPNFQIADASKIKNSFNTLNRSLREYENTTAENYIAEMNWAAQESAKEATVTLLKGELGLTSFIIHPTPIGAFKAIESFTAIGNLESLLDLGVYALCKDDYYLEEGEKKAGTNGFADVLINWFNIKEDCPAIALINGVSLAVDVSSIITDVHEFNMEPSKLTDFSYGFKKIDDNSLSYMDRMGGLSKAVKSCGNIAIGRIDGLLNGEYADKTFESVFKNYKPFKELCDIDSASKDFFGILDSIASYRSRAKTN